MSGVNLSVAQFEVSKILFIIIKLEYVGINFSVAEFEASEISQLCAF